MICSNNILHNWGPLSGYQDWEVDSFLHLCMTFILLKLFLTIYQIITCFTFERSFNICFVHQASWKLRQKTRDGLEPGGRAFCFVVPYSSSHPSWCLDSHSPSLRIWTTLRRVSKQCYLTGNMRGQNPVMECWGILLSQGKESPAFNNWEVHKFVYFFSGKTFSYDNSVLLFMNRLVDLTLLLNQFI